MYAIALPFPSPMADFFATITQIFPRPIEYRREQSEIEFTDEQRGLLAELVRPVQPDGRSGIFRGACMTLQHTKLAMCMSGDWNPVHCDPNRPHPMFGKLVAHGVDGVSQGLVAAHQVIGRLELVPYQVEIMFQKPVFLGEDRLLIHVLEKTMTEYEVTIRAITDDPDVPERDVTKMRLICRQGSWSGEEWFRALMSLWRISALLAETWDGCLYAKQTIQFQRPIHGDVLAALVRGTGRNSRGHCTVHTQVHDPRYPLLPAVTGTATIVLPS